MKIAIIGFGGMGEFHLDKCVERYNAKDRDEKIEVVGIYDISEERCRYAASRGLRCYTSKEELFADGEVETVVIATPNDLHLPYVREAAAVGKNIIVEKPAGMSLAEVEAMYEAAESNGVVFSPHQNRRWDDDFVTLKSIFESGELGRGYRIESRVMGANGIPGAWRKEVGRGGGMMLDWGVHLIDQMLSFGLGKIKSVMCSYSYMAGEEVDDGFWLEVLFECGVTYRIVVDTNTFIKLPRWQMYAEDGTATVVGWHNGALEGRTVKVILRHDDKLVGVSAGNGFTKTMANRRSETVLEKPIEFLMGDKTAFYTNFLDAVRGRCDTVVKKEEILELFRVMEAARLSSERGEVIKENLN